MPLEQEGFDSGVSWDQDFTLNKRECEHYKSTRQASTEPQSRGGKGHPLMEGGRRS